MSQLVRAAQTFLLIIAGLGGQPQYSDAFHGWAATMIDAAEDRYGLDPSNTTYLGEDPERDPARIDGGSTRENVEAAVREIAARARPGDQVLFLLIGHGSYQGEVSKFNLPGPDMTAADFASLLESLSAQTIAFVNTASASGDFVPALSGPNRSVITATKSPFERNETLFGGFFVEAFAAEGSDLDKDGAVSILEAFNYARREVERVYEGEGRLLTEHAQLDDNGDGVGSGSAEQLDAGTGDGALSRSFALGGVLAATAGGEEAGAASDPELLRLLAAKRDLEVRIAALKGRKEGMEPDSYLRELEALLLDLARTDRAIRARHEDDEGGRG